MKHKILIIGSPGSGKSYFARELTKIIKIPLYYLDCLYWHENWTPTPKEEFVKIQNEIMDTSEWIIDGNYFKTLEDRLKKAEVVFFLNFESEVCLKQAKQRVGQKRDDLPHFLNEEDDEEFYEFIRDFPKNVTPKIIELLNKYQNIEVHTFYCQKDKEEFLDHLCDNV